MSFTPRIYVYTYMYICICIYIYTRSKGHTNSYFREDYFRDNFLCNSFLEIEKIYDLVYLPIVEQTDKAGGRGEG